MDYIELGSAPVDEECVQVNPLGDYHHDMLLECQNYKGMLQDRFPIPEGIIAYFKVKWFPHEFGSYAEVCLFYNDNDDDACDFALYVEDNLPNTWTNTPILIFSAWQLLRDDTEE